MELTAGIHLVDGVSSNVYLIVEPDGLSVIDTGMPGSGPKIAAYVRKIERDPQEVRHIVLTHQHYDHVGGAVALAAMTGAEVVAHPDDAPAIEGRAKRQLAHGLLRPVFLVMVPVMLKSVGVKWLARGGETLPILVADGGLRVIATPGHTTGHISLYSPGRKMLFAGDAYMHRGDTIIATPGIFNTDTAEAKRSLKRLATEFEIEASLPGHGNPMLSGAGAKLAEATRS